MSVADTFVTIRPDTDGFRAEADAELRKALADAGVTVKVGADTATATAAADRLKAKLADLSKQINVGIDIGDKPAQAKLLALQAQLIEIGKKVVSPKLDLAGVAQAQAGLAALDVSLDQINAKRVAPQVTPNVDTARLDAFKASLDQLSTRVANVTVGADDKDATAKLLGVQAKLEELGAKTANPNIDVAGLARAEADLAALDARLDETGAKNETARVSVDTSSGVSAVTALVGLIAGIGPALLPLGAGLLSGVGALGGAGAAAGAGFAGIAAVAVPAITAVKGVLTDQTAAQKAVTTATGQSATSQIQSANGIKAAQLSLSNAQRSAANQAITSAEAVKNAQQSLGDAQRKQANDQITSAETIGNARRTLSDAESTAAFDQQTSTENVSKAEQSLAQAQQQELLAQQNLTQARVAAKQALQDLQHNLADAVLSQRQDVLNLQQAQQQLNATMANPASTALQRQQAQLSYDQAKQGLADQQLQVSRLTDQQKQASKDGVNGSAQVVAAKQAEQQADQGVFSATQAVADAKRAAARQAASDQESITKAQQGVADAQRTAAQTSQADAEAIAKAQQAVGDAVRSQADSQASSAASIQSAQLGVQNAYASSANAAKTSAGAGSAAAKTLADAMAKLTPSERDLLTAFDDFKGAYTDWVHALEPDVVPLLTTGLGIAQGLFKDLKPIVADASGAFLDLERDAGKALKDPFWQGFFSFLDGQAKSSVKTFGTVAGDAVTGIAGLIEAFGPDIKTAEGDLLSLSGQFSHFGQDAAAGKSGPFNEFQAFVHDTAPQVKTTLGDLGTLLGKIVTGLAPSATPSLKLISDIAILLDPIVTALGKYLPGAITDVGNLVDKLKPLTKALADPFVKGVADAIHEFATFLGDVAGAIDKIPEPILKPIAEGLGLIVGAVALNKLTGISRLSGYLRGIGTSTVGLPGKLSGVAGPVEAIGTNAGRAAAPAGKFVGALSGLAGAAGWAIGLAELSQATQAFAYQKFPALKTVDDTAKAQGKSGYWDIARAGIKSYADEIDNALGIINKIPGAATFAGKALFTLPSGKVITITGKDAVTKFAAVVKDNVDHKLTPASLKILGIDNATAVANGVKIQADAVGKLTPTVHLGAEDRASLTIGTVGGAARSLGRQKPDVKISADDRATDTMNKISQRAANLGQKNPDIRIDATDAASKVIGGVTGGLGKLQSSIASVKEHLRDLADRAFKVEVDATGKWSASGKTAIPGHADGGLIRGPGGPKSDSILMRGSAGEFMQNADAVRREGVPAMAALNAGDATIVPRFAGGGFINVGGASHLSPINTGTDKFLNANIKAWVQDTFDKQLQASGPAGGPGGKVNYHASAGVAQWTNTVKHVLDLLHQPLSLANDILALIAFESAGNPNAVNLSDINARRGTPSVGLAQVIGPTFAANAGPFLHTGPFAYGVSEDPTANVYAGMHYGIKTYGGIANIPGIQSVNRGGGYKPYATGGDAPGGSWGLVGDAGPELVNFHGPATIYSNAQSQRMAPGLGPVPAFATGGHVAPKKITGTTFTSPKLFEQAGQHLLDVILSGFTSSRAVSTIQSATDSLLHSIDADFTGSKKSGLVAYTTTVNRQMQTLAKERDAIAAKIASANTVSTGLSSAAQSFASITNLGGTAGAGDIATGLQTKLQYIKSFGTNLTKLSKLGYSKALIAQIIAAGPDTGGPLAEQLAAATKTQVSSINATESAIGKASTGLGTTAVNAQFGGDVARGFVGGLQAQTRNLDKQMNNLADVFVKHIGKSFHLKGYAGGGTVGPGEVAIAGELGPEIITGPGRVYPAAQSAAMRGTGIDYDRLVSAFNRATGVRTAPLIGSAVFQDNTDVELTLRRAAFVAQSTGLSG